MSNKIYRKEKESEIIINKINNYWQPYENQIDDLK